MTIYRITALFAPYCTSSTILSCLLYSLCLSKHLLALIYDSHHLTAALFSEEAQQDHTHKTSDFIATFCLLQISHAAVSALCRSIKLQCELYSSRQIAICLDPYCGLGFVLWCLARYVRSIPPLRSPSDVSGFHLCLFLVFTQVISPSSSPPLSWRAACRCG